MLDEPDVPLLTFINAVRFSYCIKQACFRVVGINRVPGAIKKCFPQLRRVFLFVFFCIYLFIFLTNKKALMSLFLHGLFLLKAGKEEAVKVLFVSLCRRRFGLCYKSFYVHVELLFAHILSCDSFLPQFEVVHYIILAL